VTPIVLSSFTSGFNIALDISQDEDFVSLYGLNKTEVRDGLERILPKLKKEVIDKIIDKWELQNNGYRFNPS